MTKGVSLMAHELKDSGLFRLSSMRALATLLHWKKCPSALRALCIRPDNWDEFEQERPGKTPRKIQAPKEAVKALQRRLNELFQRIVPPDYLHSGTPKRSYLTNSALHMGVPGATVTVDISDFYPSVTRKRLFMLFREVFQCAPDVADALAGLMSCRGALATGSPASALVSFWACKDMFDAIAARTLARGGRFSLYVDDMTLTARTAGAGDVKFLERHVRNFGFRLSDSKSRVYPSSAPREVTGRVIFDGVSRAPNRHHEQMHEALKCLAGGEATEARARSAVGKIEHIAILDSERRGLLKQRAKRVRARYSSRDGSRAGR